MTDYSALIASGQSPRQIADELGIPLDTLYQRLWRAGIKPRKIRAAIVKDTRWRGVMIDGERSVYDIGDLGAVVNRDHGIPLKTRLVRNSLVVNLELGGVSCSRSLRKLLVEAWGDADGKRIYKRVLDDFG